MMQTTDPWNGDDVAKRGWLYRTRENHQNEALSKMPKVQVLDAILSASEHEGRSFQQVQVLRCRATRANYRRRREYYREYERKRAQEPTRRAYQLELNRRYRSRRQKQAEGRAHVEQRA